MSIVVTAGQRGDSPQFEPVLEKVRPASGRASHASAPIGCGLTCLIPVYPWLIQALRHDRDA